MKWEWDEETQPGPDGNIRAQDEVEKNNEKDKFQAFHESEKVGEEKGRNEN